ncbi:unnamed protein product [Orchesella dallaii]|uniref:Uncharacterized protein n=1 Tax=Orchesella dallaii TaxID=48710 RepID=A0ABP1PN21_9HEXA
MDCSQKENIDTVPLTTSDDGTEGSTEPSLGLSIVKGVGTSVNGEAAVDSGNSSSGDTPEPRGDQDLWDIEYRFNDCDDNPVVQLSDCEQEQMEAEADSEFEYIINTFILPSLFYDPPAVRTVLDVFKEDNKENEDPQ